MKNPFVLGQSVFKDGQFFGRQRELESILSFIKKRNSCSVVGERRIGKTSLLQRIALLGKRDGHIYGTEAFNFVYVNLHSAECSSDQVALTKFLLKKLFPEFEINQEELNHNPLAYLSTQLRENIESGGQMPVLLFDEFERFIEKEQFCNDTFFEGLRAISQEHAVLVTSSLCSLHALTMDNKLTSPLYNVFAPTKLDLFTVDEANEFITSMWENLNITDEEKRSVLSLHNKHPLILQIISHEVFEARATQSTESDIQKAIASNIAHFFKTPHEIVMQSIHRYVIALPEKIEWTTAFIGKNIKNLLPIKTFFSS